MSSPEARHPSRRTLVAGAISLIVPTAGAAELPLVLGGRSSFVQFKPQPAMHPMLLRDLQGRPAVLGLSKHEALILYVWAAWCSSCLTELAQLAHDQAAPTKLGVSVSTVSIDTTSAAAVATYLRKLGVTGLQVFHDPDSAVLAADRPDGKTSPFHRWSMPLTFAIDRAGDVRGYISGGIDWLRPESIAFLQALSA